MPPDASGPPETGTLRSPPVRLPCLAARSAPSVPGTRVESPSRGAGDDARRDLLLAEQNFKDAYFVRAVPAASGHYDRGLVVHVLHHIPPAPGSLRQSPGWCSVAKNPLLMALPTPTTSDQAWRWVLRAGLALFGIWGALLI